MVYFVSCWVGLVKNFMNDFRPDSVVPNPSVYAEAGVPETRSTLPIYVSSGSRSADRNITDCCIMKALMKPFWSDTSNRVVPNPSDGEGIRDAQSTEEDRSVSVSLREQDACVCKFFFAILTLFLFVNIVINIAQGNIMHGELSLW